jgi:hypothetical protein
MTKIKIDFREIGDLALSNSLYLVKKYLPDGVQQGQEWVAKNPLRHDRNIGSFKVNLATGRWADFATGDRGGDLISLLAYIRRISQKEAAIRISEELGGCYE